MDKKQILLKLEKTRQLFTLPEVFGEALELVESDDASIKDIADVVVKDPTLTTKVLNMANSSFYKREGEISTVKKAVLVLGANALKSLVLSASLLTLYSLNKNSDNKDDDPKLFWKHSLETGIGAQLLAREINYPDPEEGLVSGLLHDIGIMFLQMAFPDEYKKVRQLIKSGKDIISAENEVFGSDHTEIGALMAKKWNIPQKFIYTIEYHHLLEGQSSLDSIDSLALLTALSNNLARNDIEYGHNNLEYKIININKLSNILGISREKLDKLRSHIIDQFLVSASNFDMDIGDPMELLSQANAELCKIYLTVENLFRERQELSRKLLIEERHSGAVESLHIAMSTLAHYINNSTMAISGRSQILRMLKAGNKIGDPEGKLAKSLDVIDASIVKIGAILEVLKEISSLEDIQFFENSRAINIEEQLKERIDEKMKSPAYA